ncbi:MAG: ATP-binding protein [Deltaproteobacteria bacterium]|nr:ATP-binding protein [Deltaproteobacteria bacterium]
MKIAVASGKGGTGKTTVATNLALTAGMLGEMVTYLDCDVEEPNGHLFLHPEMQESSSIGVPVPQVDKEKCNGCGKCADICQYSAIVCVKENVLIFPGLCHACGGCKRVCPTGAISEISRDIGTIEQGYAEHIGFVHGRLNIGDIMVPPLIRAVKKIDPPGIQIIDTPPGTSCPVITTLRGADFVLLVTEPTPFGLNDLGLAVETVKELGIDYAVVVNRADEDNPSAQQFCQDRGIPIIAEIPDDRRIAEAYSRGELIISALPQYRDVFEKLFRDIQERLSTRSARQGVL